MISLYWFANEKLSIVVIFPVFSCHISYVKNIDFETFIKRAVALDLSPAFTMQ